jgi:hypothetical protein
VDYGCINKERNPMAKNLKNIVSQILLILFCALILALSIRGLPGNPTAADLNTLAWRDNGPFELSPERGRYALAYSVVEDGSVFFSKEIAQFADPDVGYNVQVRKYASLFAPGLSFLVMPGYFIGKYFGLAQVGTFSVIGLFAITNVMLIRAIAMRLGASSIASTIGALSFLFATPAFTYAVTLYQHHVSSFLILMSIYTLLRWNSIWSLGVIWFMFAASLPLDNPNLFFFLPIALFSLGRFFSIKHTLRTYIINFNVLGVLTFITMIIPLVFFLWFNSVSNSSPFKLSGSLKTVNDIKKETNLLNDHADTSEAKSVQIREKNVLGFFKTRNLLNGFYIHAISPDRGTLMYAPVMLFGFIGMVVAYRKKRNSVLAMMIAVVGIIILLYSMWGDPYGGWAFGSRYMVPAYAVLSIFVALLLNEWKTKLVFLALFFLALTYSVSVNTLGAITSSRNPPQIEAVGLEKLSHMKEYYTYQRNINILNSNISKSFVYEAVAKQYVTAWQYYSILIGMLLLPLMILMSMVSGNEATIISSKSKVQNSKFNFNIHSKIKNIKRSIKFKA